MQYLLNDFYAQFEAQNNVEVRKTIPPPNDQVLCLSLADVRRTLCRVNPWKSAGTDNIPGRVLRECAEQLADVFTDIFNISLTSAVVPTCLKTMTIIPVLKKSTVSCLNDYRPVALTPIMMKCFERLIMRQIKTQLPPSLDPLQFVYHPNHSTDNIFTTTLHLSLTHLDNKDTYVQMLFIDFSSAFNTIIPQHLIEKLSLLALNNSLCNWILDFALMSKAKQKAYDELYTRLDTREGEKDLYRLARQRDQDEKDVQQVRVIKDRDGRVLTSEESVQRRWKEYFEELMNEENEREKRVEGVNSVEQKVDKIRKDEVRKALKRMKSGKAVGPDDILVEVWNCLGEAEVDFLTSLFNRVLENLEKAYDRVPREELWYCMRKSGVAEKYVRVVQDMYERSKTVVRCAVGQTEEFKVEVELHQGTALSPFLFAIVMDQLSEEVRQESPWTMMFADDIVICSESREQVEESLERWRFALERRGMKVSRSKTEYMCVTEREGSGTVRLQGEEVKKVQEFKYLGSTVQSNGECRKEVKKRVRAGWNGWRKVSGVLCDRKISARIKGKVYRTVVRPAMLYGLETVSLRKRQESELEVAELKMLRFSLGVTRLDRIRNEYIRRTAHVGRLGDKVREARLKWFGHVQRREKILEHFMLPSADQLFEDADFIFQQDLAPAHTAKSTKSWLNDHGVGVLDWPANSPDLNPIENLWGIVKRKMRNKRPKNADELKATVKETWASIPPQQCHKLITSMPRRIEAIIKAREAPTKY
ncbi:hypothetical protein QTP86_002602 [Hemibagrus guttatus]|nr:hypothetical protein QTP86_002602 [Hemibagrus guttatus]